MSQAAPVELVAMKALDGLHMRMAAISQNLANASSANYQPVSVDFETALRQAAGKGPEALRETEFQFTAGRPYRTGEDRRIDLAMADAAQTASRYSALVSMLGRRIALREAAIGGAN